MTNEQKRAYALVCIGFFCGMMTATALSGLSANSLVADLQRTAGRRAEALHLSLRECEATLDEAILTIVNEQSK